jgi:DNA primase
VGVALPFDFSRTDIPLAALTWLRKYGITDNEVAHFRFGYSPRLERLILPVFKSDGLVYWQGRYLGTDPDKPKYLNVRAKGRADVFFTRNTCNTKNVVLVEDILSAIKVGRVTGACALLGSHVPDSLLTFLSGRGTIRVWLDRDKARVGIKAARRIAALTGRPCFPVITPLDPKEYSEIKIEKLVGRG